MGRTVAKPQLEEFWSGKVEYTDVAEVQFCSHHISWKQGLTANRFSIEDQQHQVATQDSVPEGERISHADALGRVRESRGQGVSKRIFSQPKGYGMLFEVYISQKQRKKEQKKNSAEKMVMVERNLIKDVPCTLSSWLSSARASWAHVLNG